MPRVALSLLLLAGCDVQLPVQPSVEAGVVKQGKGGSAVLRVAHEVGAAAFTPDGGRLVTGGSKGLALWDLASGKRLGLIEAGHEFTVTRVEIQPDGALVAVAEGFNNTKGGYYLGDVGSFENIKFKTSLKATRGVASDFQDFSFGPPRRLAAKAKDSMKVVNLDEKRVFDIGKLEGYGDGAIERIALDPTGKHAAYAFQLYGGRGKAMTYKVFLWDLKAKNIVWEKGLAKTHLKALRFSPDGRVLAAGTTDLTLLWPVDPDAGELEPVGVGGMRLTLTFSPDGTRIAATHGRAKKAQVFEVATGKMVFEQKSAVRGITHYAFSADGKRLAAIGGKMIEIWDL